LELIGLDVSRVLRVHLAAEMRDDRLRDEVAALCADVVGGALRGLIAVAAAAESGRKLSRSEVVRLMMGEGSSGGDEWTWLGCDGGG